MVSTPIAPVCLRRVFRVAKSSDGGEGEGEGSIDLAAAGGLSLRDDSLVTRGSAPWALGAVWLFLVALDGFAVGTGAAGTLTTGTTGSMLRGDPGCCGVPSVATQPEAMAM